MDMERLKAETRIQHEATESAMPLMQAGLTRSLYASVLCRLYPVVSSWESWTLAHCPQDLLWLIKDRQRSELIARDLRSLALTDVQTDTVFPAHRVPGLHSRHPRFRSSFLGAMYVVEGSTLGGQHIARHVQTAFGFHPLQGDAYFHGYGERTSEMWRTFKSVVSAVPECESEHVIAAANAMFAVFRTALVNPAAEPCATAQ